MKIKKIKSQGEFVYPATIAAAVKDANFLKEDNSPMTLGEINLYLNESVKDVLVDGESVVDEDGVATVNIHVIQTNMTDATASIKPNIFYVWGEVSLLDITLEAATDTTIYNEYMFQFSSGDSATTLILPDNITWYLNNNTILPNKTYQVSIVNNLAILGEF